jgi:AcrR family transcriptional regulator
MRVTAATKEATKQRIRDAARELFRTQGFDATTTRGMAQAAGIAVGTLFNYYSSKEALALEFIGEALDEADALAQKRIREGMPLEEELFLWIATGLRQLRPDRELLRPVFDLAYSPASAPDQQGYPIRARHLEAVAGILQKHHPGSPALLVQLQMYWMLYTGLLAFWINDASPKQEDTLALLDHSLKMYTTWLTASGKTEREDGRTGEGEI